MPLAQGRECVAFRVHGADEYGAILISLAGRWCQTSRASKSTDTWIVGIQSFKCGALSKLPFLPSGVDQVTSMHYPVAPFSRLLCQALFRLPENTMLFVFFANIETS